MKLDLSGVTPRKQCQKRGCATGDWKIDRHHKAHQALFVAYFRGPRGHTDKYRRFAARYASFHRDDIIHICNTHHKDIHLIYNEIIDDDMRQRHRALATYSWSQAETLMLKLEMACDRWLREED